MASSILHLIFALILSPSVHAGNGFGEQSDNIQKSPFFERALAEVLQDLKQPALPSLEWDSLNPSERAQVNEIVKRYEKAEKTLRSQINFIKSLYQRGPNADNASDQALQIRNQTIDNLVRTYAHSRRDIEDEDLNFFRQQLLNWSEALPDFNVTTNDDREVGPDEMSRRKYMHKLAKTFALTLQRYENAGAEEKEVLGQISARILSEAYLVAAMVEPSHAGVAEEGARYWFRLLWAPLLATSWYVINDQDQMAQLMTLPFIVNITIFLQNAIVRDAGQSKPWLVPNSAKKRAHLKRMERILNEFVSELIFLLPTKFHLYDSFSRPDFNKIRQDLTKIVLNSEYQPSHISSDDCDKVLRR